MLCDTPELSPPRAPNTFDDPEGALEALLRSEQYAMPYREKCVRLLSLIKHQLRWVGRNVHLQKFFETQRIRIDHIEALADVPWLPVQMFKYFDLSTCRQDEVVRTVMSSGTTSGLQSRIPLNKRTAAQQARALSATLAHYLGNRRKSFLVIDHEGINAASSAVTARTTGVRGLSMFAKETYYLLRDEGGVLRLNHSVLDAVRARCAIEDVYVFGFTYIIWSVFLRQASREGLRLPCGKGKFFHSGGWKNIEEEGVSKDAFSNEVSTCFEIDKKHIHDFYGMAEQGGIIFLDCEYGNKHVPNFAAVIIRDMRTLKPSRVHEIGLIEVMSVLADSYYAQAILTEDTGELMGVDDCQCGRLGEYFQFRSRVKRAELRGCGDTFKETVHD